MEKPKEEKKPEKKVTVQEPAKPKDADIFQALARIQQELKAPKSQFNKFASFHYRSCEDILEAVKPLLRGLYLVLFDEVVIIGTRYYVKATASISNGDKFIGVSAYAREAEVKKGMDEAQITGSSSSYARKYALNGLFCIDDTKETDSPSEDKSVKAEKLVTEQEMKDISGFLQVINNASTMDKLNEIGGTISKQTLSDNQKIILREAYEGKKQKLVVK